MQALNANNRTKGDGHVAASFLWNVVVPFLGNVRHDSEALSRLADDPTHRATMHRTGLVVLYALPVSRRAVRVNPIYQDEPHNVSV